MARFLFARDRRNVVRTELFIVVRERCLKEVRRRGVRVNPGGYIFLPWEMDQLGFVLQRKRGDAPIIVEVHIAGKQVGEPEVLPTKINERLHIMSIPELTYSALWILLQALGEDQLKQIAITLTLRIEGRKEALGKFTFMVTFSTLRTRRQYRKSYAD